MVDGESTCAYDGTENFGQPAGSPKFELGYGTCVMFSSLGVLLIAREVKSEAGDHSKA